MQKIQEDMNNLREQLRTGSIQRAYKALLSYMRNLQNHFKNGYPRYFVSGLYQGYMDMTCFAITPPSLKRRDLKFAIVFNYEAFKFEGRLAGTNRQVQRKYRELFRNSRLTDYRIVKPAKDVDSIIECDLAEDPDFGYCDRLTAIIEAGTIEFVDDVERFLSDHETGVKA